MAAQQQTPMSARIPPDLPSDPSISGALGVYLRNFALWCRNGFAEQMRNNEAVRGLMLRGYDTPPGTNPKIWMLEASDAGVAFLAPMALGSPGSQPGTPVPIGAAATNTNDNAPPGQIGEVISSVVTTGVPFASNATVNVATISLTPGDWDVRGDVWLVGFGGGTVLAAGISPQSMAIPGTPTINGARTHVTGSAMGQTVLPVMACRASLAVTTPYYLLAGGTYATGSGQGMGTIIARRVR